MLQSTSPSRTAVATLLTHESYVVGALTLGYSLGKQNWRHDSVVMVTAAVSADARRQLLRFWNHVIEIEPVANPNPKSRMGIATFATVYTKLRAWELDDYETVLLLDADTIAVNELNDLPQCKSIAGAPDTLLADIFNTGVLVLRPSRVVFADMMEKISTLPSYDGGDQGFLNSYFPDWFHGDACYRLPQIYNVSQLTFFYHTAWNRLLPVMKILHFTGSKPWQRRKNWKNRIKERLKGRPKYAPRRGPTPNDIWWRIHNEMQQELARRETIGETIAAHSNV